MAGEAARARASPKQASPRPGCRVCALPAGERDLVNGGLLSGWSPRSVAARFTSVSRKDISRHMMMCVNEQEEKEA
jgi:hypothetical protein